MTARSAARPRRGVRVAGRATAAVGVLLLVVLAGVGWYYSEQVLATEPGSAPAYDLSVTDVRDGQVTLEGPGADRAGVWGLDLADGYAQVGPVVSQTAGTVTRTLRGALDVPTPGAAARLDAYAYPDDPSVFGFVVEEVAVPGPGGDYPAWHTAGPQPTWVVAVHGRGAPRTEAFRLLPTLVDLGLPTLVVSYRNDPGAPAAPDGRYRLGWTEWQEVDAAVAWARDRGAADVVLVGLSTGGSIVGSYLRERGEGGVRGVVLDAPVVDWGATLRAAAADRGLPTWLTPVAQTAVSVRTGIRWEQLDLLARAGELGVPVLLFHGDADGTVPVGSSEALARARPDLVTFVRVAGAGHVASWNADPVAYDAALRAFLADLPAPPADLPAPSD